MQTVERALELHGPPVYVRKEIVHNKHVVASLRERGAIFVDELDDSIPEGAITVFSAHGVSPAVHADAERRGLQTIDATCPLVTKVHREAVKFAGEGYTIVLIGHAGHEEVEGTTGEAPDHIVLVQTEEDVDALEVPDPDKVAYISQTTLSVDETRSIINRLREKFPASPGRAPTTSVTRPPTASRRSSRWPPSATSCSSSAPTNSSNSQRLVDVARDCGAAAHLIDNETQVQEEWLEGARVVGISSGASAPEELVERLVQFFRDRGTRDGRDLRGPARGRPLHAAEGRSGSSVAARATLISSPCSSSAGGGSRTPAASPSRRSGGATAARRASSRRSAPAPARRRARTPRRRR